MTSNRVRKNSFYQKGRDYADGLELENTTGLQRSDNEEAFRAGFNDRKEEQGREAERLRLQTEDLSTLLHEARVEQDFDKLCNVIERLIDAQS